MASIEAFRRNIYDYIHQGPLRELAMGISRLLFLNKNTCVAPNNDTGIDLLVLCSDFEEKIVHTLLQFIEEYKRAALANTTLKRKHDGILE